MCVRVASVYVRRFSSSTASSGMMLLFEPARMLPTVSTAGSVGAISRATTVCSRTTMSAARTTGSTVFCGIDPCPPRPYTVMRTLSALESTGPGRVSTVPAGPGSTCCASATSGFGRRSASPSSSIPRAPSPVSSAGWNSATTVPLHWS